MYTQCPDCATVFRVTAEALRIAQGDVRCGVCSTSFNALENLSEQAFKAATEGDAPAADDSMTVEELPGGENIELSAPVELAMVPDLPAVEPEPAGDEDEERAMEFHGDAADLDRLFVVENAGIEPFDPGSAAASLSEAEPVIDLDSTDEHPILVLDERDDVSEEPIVESIVLETVEPVAAPPPPQPPPPRLPPPAPRAPPAPPPPPPMPVASAHTAPRILIPDEMRKRLAEEAEARAAASAVFEPDESSRLPVAALALGRRRRGARVSPAAAGGPQPARRARPGSARPRGRGPLCVSRADGAGAHGPFGL